MTTLGDHVKYNRLPSLEEAAISLKTLPVADIINGPIRDVFLKHDAHHKFCLHLQHRHHTVGANEAIVKVNGTAHLMDHGDIDKIIRLGYTVFPTT
ncbi:hypothetical protein W97_08391 [Coniosporium apollinis CBS 100218]|uniref:Uncharacterized protein n=1 Tax=Coniosporium apollinis (strain CBS 100218) TaxID=1168221 RepID=R7Z4Q3_CONA1|nr:uncharacterized protein W97_08391 [Coniosporium apollinis CBS 100218]EON69078.1 hypothetical protein W97_08391 [Coniosporium apollinis CBS 100218]